MKLGFIFAGQGAQYIGMGKELYDNYPQAKEVFDSVKLDFDVKKLCFNGDTRVLNDTAYAQPAIFTTSLAIANVIKSKGIVPDYVAGLSLGEYSALCFANSFSVEDGAQIVRERGKLMAYSLPKETSVMYAILNLSEERIKQSLQEVKDIGICEIANYNCPGQIVITGEEKATRIASEKCMEKGARRVMKLNVSGAFHSSLLNEASKRLNEILNNYNIKKPNIPVVYNIYGSENYDDSITDILTKQIRSSVYFMQSISYMIDKGVDAFIEIGPGKVLKGFVRKINSDVPVYSVEDINSLEKMLEEIKDGK